MRAGPTRRSRGAAGAAVLCALVTVCACTPVTDDEPPAATERAASDEPTEPDEPDEPAEPAEPGEPATRFDDSGPTVGQVQGSLVYVVGGVDVVPGIYRTVDAQVTDGMDGGILFDRSCKFGQYSDADGGLDALIAGGTADGGHPTITLGEGQLFRSQRCGAWELVDEADLFDAPDTAPTTVTDGMWLVGEDLRPGTYRTDATFTGEYVEGAFCGWEVDSTWTDWDGAILDVAVAGPGPGEVTLATGQQFVSAGCGTWRLVG